MISRAIARAFERWKTRGLVERLAREKAAESSPAGRLARGLVAQNVMQLPKWKNRRKR